MLTDDPYRLRLLHQSDFHHAEDENVGHDELLFAGEAIASRRVEVPGVFQIVFNAVVVHSIDEVYLLLVFAEKLCNAVMNLQ